MNHQAFTGESWIDQISISLGVNAKKMPSRITSECWINKKLPKDQGSSLKAVNDKQTKVITHPNPMYFWEFLIQKPSEGFFGDANYIHITQIHYSEFQAPQLGEQNGCWEWGKMKIISWWDDGIFKKRRPEMVKHGKIPAWKSIVYGSFWDELGH